jgi:enoyl-CoA hydratase/carnithine racemase
MIIPARDGLRVTQKHGFMWYNGPEAKTDSRLRGNDSAQKNIKHICHSAQKIESPLIAAIRGYNAGGGFTLSHNH